MPDHLFGGRYQLHKTVGRGGMSAVILATDLETQAQVAIKLLTAPPDSADPTKSRFRLEAKSLAQLNHPNIVRLLDYGEINGRPYLVLEWIPGGTLASWMEGALPYRDAAALVLPVARALEYAHAHGILHRDVKPSNIMMAQGGIPRLTDFGIAKWMAQTSPATLTGVGVGLGTPEYMAPEQGLGQPIDQRVDIYSLGVIFFELVTGKKPFTADTPLGTMMQHAVKPLPSACEMVPGLPIEVDEVISKAMAKDPADRFTTMGEFADCLERLARGDVFAAGLPPGGLPLIEMPAKPIAAVAAAAPQPLAAPAGPAQPARGPSLRRWTLPLGIGVGGVAAVLLLLWLFGAFTPARGSHQTRFASVIDLEGAVFVQEAGAQPAQAQRGTLVALESGTRFSTQAGMARLAMPDGTTLVLGEQSALIFPKPAANGATVQPAFNLLYGVALVEDGKVNTDPFNFILADKVAISGIGAEMGIRVQQSGANLQDIDCLDGTCQVVSGGQLASLTAGQHVYIGVDGTLHPADGVDTTTWAALAVWMLPQGTDTPTAETPTQESPTPTPSLTETETETPTGTLPVTATATPTGVYRYSTPTPTAPSSGSVSQPPPPSPTSVPPGQQNTPQGKPPTNTPRPTKTH